ncbi:MAG: nucleotidyltransferase domain-containing protein [Methylothermaceae bacterium]|nr:nucleotidyltransferase domain-containing protein [Methylothermaceae bacterium]
MRLSPGQRDTIRKIVKSAFGRGARVFLFGSRLDDVARGGDIDLYVEVDYLLPNRAAAASRLIAELQRVLGDQSIDVVLVDPGTQPQPVHEIARRQGVAL